MSAVYIHGQGKAEEWVTAEKPARAKIGEQGEEGERDRERKKKSSDMM